MLDKLLLAALLIVTSAATPSTATVPVPTSPLSAPRGSEPTIEVVDIQVSETMILKASFYVPKGDEKAPAALLIHDAGSDRKSMAALAESMWKAGYAVLTIDLRGHGESINEESDDYRKLESDKDREAMWAFAYRDIESAVRWLRSNKLVHSSNLNVIGNGAGCALAVRHAARDENVRTVTLINPKATILGFSLSEDLLDLEGIPTYFLASKESRKSVETLAAKIHEDLDCTPFIELVYLKAKTDAETLEDKKLASSITRPLKDQAFPKKGPRNRD
jgi:pimeloyl-ACP methyl ester carboxylesterase